MCKTDEHESLRLILDPSECAVELHVKRKVNGRHGPEAVARSFTVLVDDQDHPKRSRPALTIFVSSLESVGVPSYPAVTSL